MYCITSFRFKKSCHYIITLCAHSLHFKVYSWNLFRKRNFKTALKSLFTYPSNSYKRPYVVKFKVSTCVYVRTEVTFVPTLQFDHILGICSVLVTRDAFQVCLQKHFAVVRRQTFLPEYFCTRQNCAVNSGISNFYRRRVEIFKRLTSWPFCLYRIGQCSNTSCQCLSDTVHIL